ncbi:MAG: GNAT family N-acetyltransferase [Clostridia bacterium]|nr:GNAT family N-acetyltransferase [Clostridia bacterium]
MENIRNAQPQDAGRLAEIEVFCYRQNFYPIFRNDAFYFDEMTVAALTAAYDEETLARTLVYDDGAVKGFLRLRGTQVEKLFVEPVLQGAGIGAALLTHAVALGADHLWALEKNTRAIAFYARHGFHPTGERAPEEDTEEYLIRLAR